MRTRYEIVSLLGLLLALGAAGCRSNPATSTDVGDTIFLTYEGKQGSWPISDHVLVENDLIPPVYHGLPARSYTILGRIVGTQHNPIGRGLAEGLWNDRDRLSDVCTQARMHHADAVILTDNQQIMEALQAVKGAAGEADRPVYSFDGAAVAVKWTSQTPQPVPPQPPQSQ